ncbi:hypothetical protein B0H34DRAFT_683633 [Crassisporium funariophilum]|nr:hypothetical protein B0H34DRAFT_683633 [Crassisporium funariophilum]
MNSVASPIPFISISPAPQEEPLIEPFSPFTPHAFPIHNDDGFRPAHLTPPPTVTRFKRTLSPLHPVGNSISGKGLESQRFQALLTATKQRNASGGVKRSVDLRKEIAVKVHHNKQVERRALFLSKVHAPPSPTATITPKTPPESPSIFHYSLPSPGLESPLALFESLNDRHAKSAPPRIWVEQVDFRKAKSGQDYSYIKPVHGLPSLDQISARLIPRTTRVDGIDLACDIPVKKEQARPSVGIGRLRMPLRTQNLDSSAKPSERSMPAPKSPLLHLPPSLHVTTLVVPRTHSTSPVELTETNLQALNSRGQSAIKMLSTLRKRALASDYRLTCSQDEGDEKVKARRRSAPADMMPFRARTGFEHPVLALPGGF